MDRPSADPMQERILVLAPPGKDALAVADILERVGLTPTRCGDLRHLCAELDRGAGAVLATEDALGEGRAFLEWLERQPPWSDLPILITAGPGSRSAKAAQKFSIGARLGNAILLDRPLRSATLITAIRSALRARRRQYQVRDHLKERELAAAALKRLNETLEQRVEERTHALAEAHARLLAESEQRKTIEAHLRHAQKMEAIGQLTGGVAHDFNNLLTVVLGNLEFIGMVHDDERTQKMLRTAIRAAGRGAQLTQQLLAFARKQHLEPKPISVNDVVTGMGGLLARTIGTTIRIKQVLEPKLWRALVDPHQLELVILNLAINARDAMPVSGRLTIETANVAADDRKRAPDLPPGDLVRIAVSDTGTGMSEEVLAKAFEPFFTTKEVGRGSGLGLSQVYGVAKQSGGDVRISSKVGKGTKVDLFLPRARVVAPMEAHETTVSPDMPRGHATVLVVDDDPDVRELIGTGLKSLGYDVIEAANGHAALDLLDGVGDIDCLLVDYAMPGMTGAEVVRRAREKRPQLRVLFTTGYADSQAVQHLLRDAPLLHKPFKVADLAEKMHAALQVSDSANILRRGRAASTP
jgi:signal transduction histidine kinase/ActR/RegA family two-component response regulator